MRLSEPSTNPRRHGRCRAPGNGRRAPHAPDELHRLPLPALPPRPSRPAAARASSRQPSRDPSSSFCWWVGLGDGGAGRAAEEDRRRGVRIPQDGIQLPGAVRGRDGGMAPKFMLHHTPCKSAIEDFQPGTFFHRVIDDSSNADNTRHRAFRRGWGGLIAYPLPLRPRWTAARPIRPPPRPPGPPPIGSLQGPPPNSVEPRGVEQMGAGGGAWGCTGAHLRPEGPDRTPFAAPSLRPERRPAGALGNASRALKEGLATRGGREGMGKGGTKWGVGRPWNACDACRPFR